MANATIWQLKKGCDRRVKTQHPWVFSNEIASSIKNLRPGAPVELFDINNQFVAYGYGNPNSNICFRALSFSPYKSNLKELIYHKILLAWRNRHKLGLKNSFRLCFSENDFLSGLIIDHYTIEQTGSDGILRTGLVLAIQISSYGIEDAIKKDLKDFFKSIIEAAHKEGITPYQWSHVSLVLRNDINARKLEGLDVEEPQIIKNCDFFNLNNIDIRLTTPLDQNHLLMQVDLINGQKTGFFLDQTRNIEILLTQLKKAYDVSQSQAENKEHPPKKLKILDLCCYVGHWSTQIAYFAKTQGIELDVTLADISENALALAQKNVSRCQPAKVTTRKIDVFEELSQVEDKFDLIICDPPALIKNKKGIPTGQHAYMKLNSQAMQLLEKNALMVTCSCSGLLLKNDFLEAISKSMRRANRSMQIIFEGGHGPDHPHLAQFPEGFYLKMFLLR